MAHLSPAGAICYLGGWSPPSSLSAWSLYDLCPHHTEACLVLVMDGKGAQLRDFCRVWTGFPRFTAGERCNGKTCGMLAAPSQSHDCFSFGAVRWFRLCPLESAVVVGTHTHASDWTCMVHVVISYEVQQWGCPEHVVK